MRRGVRNLFYWLLVVSLEVMSLQSKAQNQKADKKPFYFVFNVAYGLTGFGFENFAVSNLTTDNAAHSSFNGHTSGTKFSPGLDLNAQMGYRLNKNIGLELGFGALTRTRCGNKIVALDTGKFWASYQEEIAVSIFRIIPAFRFELTKGRLHPYTRTGLIIGIPFLVNDKFTDILKDTVTIRTNSLSGRVSWGFLGAIGCRYEITNKVSVLAELSGILESWAPRRARTKSYFVNAQDELFSLNASQKEIDYNRNYTVNYTSAGGVSQSPDAPTLAPKRYLSFSTIELTVGLFITLVK
jgi:hypothetical protein